MEALLSRRLGKSRANPDPVEFALDLSPDAITLHERNATGEWKKFASVPFDDPEFPIVIGLLRAEAEAIGGKHRPVTLWLPNAQILKLQTQITAAKPAARLRAAFDYIDSETAYRREDVAVAVAPPGPQGETTLLITFADTWREARAYAIRWGFVPGDVSTRLHAGDFGTEPAVFRLQAMPREPKAARLSLAPRAATALALPAVAFAVGALFAWPPDPVRAPPEIARPKLEAGVEIATAQPLTDRLTPGTAEVLADWSPEPPIGAQVPGHSAEMPAPSPQFGPGSPPARAPAPVQLTAVSPLNAPAAPSEPQSVPAAGSAPEDDPVARRRTPAPAPLALTRAESPLHRTDAADPMAPVRWAAPDALAVRFGLSAPARVRPPVTEPAADDPPSLSDGTAPTATAETEIAQAESAQPATSDPENPETASAFAPSAGPLPPARPDRGAADPAAAQSDPAADHDAMAATATTGEPEAAEVPDVADHPELAKIMPRPRPPGLAGKETDARTEIPAPVARPAPAADPPAADPPAGGATAEEGTPPEATAAPDVPAELEAPPDPDAPTQYASLTAPMPLRRPPLPAAAREPPSSTELPFVAGPTPSSIRITATDRGLPLEQTALIGILNLDTGRKALLRFPNGEYRAVMVGDVVDGWQVSMIGLNAMRVTRNGKDLTLPLVQR